MKVLLISSVDSRGGAAIGARRLCEALIENGIECTLYVENKVGSESYIAELPRKKNVMLVRFMKKVLNKIQYHLFSTSNGIQHSLSLLSECDLSWINDTDYDLVHLHWVCDTVSIKDIAKINKPIVWTMHDSWPCCGAEHHPNILENDTRWKDGYYRSNRPKSTMGIDICRHIWNIKKRCWAGKNIHFIAPSTWEKEILASSTLFKNSGCDVIGNILPFDIFYKRDGKAERQKRGIPIDKKIVGFGAAYGLDDPRSMKGTQYLLEAISELNNDDYYLVIFGPVTDAFSSHISLPYYNEGYINDPNELAKLYSCCDCFVSSSVIENLSYTIYEALSCGTKVVAFDVGGNSDLVNHSNGYLAKPYDSHDLAMGIQTCVDEPEINSESQLVKDKYDKDSIIKKHIAVYENVINGY